MNIPHELSRIIRRSGSLSEILDQTVEIIAQELAMDVCSVYLLDPSDHRLRLVATHGLDKAALGRVVLALGEGITGTVVAEMRSISLEDASSHPGYRYFPETKEERYHAYLGVPMAIRNRPVGAIIVQSREKRVFTLDEEQTLHTISAQLVGVVENARLVQALDEPERARVYIDEVRTWNERSSGVVGQAEGEVVLRGNAASPGLAFGQTVFRGSFDLGFEGTDIPFSGLKSELERIEEVLEKTRAEILRTQELAAEEADEEHALIFSSHLLLLNDPTLTQRLVRALRQRIPAARAVDKVFTDLEHQLANVSDVYLQERVEDIRDLRNRILWHLTEREGATESLSNKIVVARGLPPSLVVEMKVQGALALLSERGGMTSHGALLARSMGIPAVTGIEELVYRIRSGDDAIIDGSRGEVVIRPTPKTLTNYRSQAERLTTTRVKLQQYRDEPARTTDEVGVTLLANVGLASEVRYAVNFGAEGIGLYRTEYPFLVREDFPTREEQVKIYERAYDAFPSRPIFFRIVDLGGDKFHPRISSPGETNPVLGYRSLRMILDQPRVLKDQLAAFIIAAHGRPLSILVPMVTSVVEMIRVRGLLDDVLEEVLRQPGAERPREMRLGAMIENPAAVEIAPDLARVADFFSIGSNDLIQFTLAVDRENARVASCADPFHPAILRMIHRAIEAAHREGKPISVCGQHAAIPAIALLLVAMGVDSLSLIPNSIPEIKDAIRSSRIVPLREQVPALLARSDSYEIRNELVRYLPDLASGDEGVAVAAE